MKPNNNLADDTSKLLITILKVGTLTHETADVILDLRIIENPKVGVHTNYQDYHVLVPLPDSTKSPIGCDTEVAHVYQIEL